MFKTRRLTISFLLLVSLATAECAAESLATPLGERADLPQLEYTGVSPRVQKPLSPEDSRRLMLVPQGFDVELFAAEPDIVNPVAVAWDDRGRLFVAEAVDYPHDLAADGKGGDRITLCEDTDGDGRADRFTRFAEELSMVSGLVCAREGLIVAHAPHILYLADTDGDDVADHREQLLTGFGTFDTHAGPSNLRYGPDGWIWGAVGYSGLEVEAGGQRQKMTMGIYRFRADGSAFEAIGGFNNNTWGLGISEDFELFGSTANNNHSIHVGIPFRYEDAARQKRSLSPSIQGHYAISAITEDLQQVDVRGGFTAAAGHHLYTARAYPKNFWNQVGLVCEPTAYLVHLARLVRHGSGFKETDGGNLLASADAWTAPVFADVGPDGQVWVCDWYNPVIQHNPDGRKADNQIWNDEKGAGNAHVNPLRDRSHGRIWRIVYTAGDPAEWPQLRDEEGAPDLDAALDALEDPNMFWRLAGQRLLLEATHSAEGLETLAYDLLPLLEEEVAPPAIHALWSLHELGLLQRDEPLVREGLEAALRHAEPAVRRAAVQVLPGDDSGVEMLLASGLLRDVDPSVRLAAVLRTCELPRSPAVADELLAAALAHAATAGGDDDPWLARALHLAEQCTTDEPVLRRTNLAVTAEAEKVRWRYSLEAPAAGWEHPDFDDAAWQVGASGFGRKGTPGARIGSDWHSKEIWLRRSFDLDAAAAEETGDVVVRIHHDEDAEVYVNGVRACALTGYTVEYADRPAAPEAVATLRAGQNTLAVHCRQTLGGQYIDVGLVRLLTELPAPADAPDAADADVTRLQLGVVDGTLMYDQTMLEVAAGSQVELLFVNKDHMPHNFVLLERDLKLEEFGGSVDAFLTDPEAPGRDYIPDVDGILQTIRMLMPMEKATLRFTAPAEPGDYPFTCTFPGHWRIMNGILRVTAVHRALEVLLVGGGSSHDYRRWVGGEDGRTLQAGGLATTAYTEDLEDAPGLEDVDVLVLTNNRAVPLAARPRIFERVAAGRGLILAHAATWYNWPDWPRYNRDLVGGGSRSHEPFGKFTVEVVAPDHPIVAGLPTSFEVEDELYRFEVDEREGAPRVEVLAVGRSPAGQEFPVLWITQNPHARIVGTTLGHDGRCHQHAAFKLLLRNATRWVGSPQ